MSWLFSPALVAAFSRDTCSDGERSAPWSAMPTARPFWRNDKPMEFSRFSRFGLTLRALTAERGEELLTWYRAGFPVRTSALQEAAPASTASDPACGWKWPASWAKYDPVSSTWKIRQCSLLEGSDEFSETWPRWGSMRDGELCPPPTLALPIFARESGLLPTPSATMYGTSNNGCPGDGRTEYATRDKPSLETMARRAAFPTPTSSDGGSNNGSKAVTERGHGTNLVGKVRAMFPTPVDASKGGGSSRSGSRIGETPSSQGMARKGLWPTATAGDAKSSGSRNGKDSAAHFGLSLTDAVRADQGRGRRFPTPRAEYSQCAGGHRGTDDTLYGAICRPKQYPTPTAQDAKNNGGGSQMERNTKPLNAEVGGPLNPEWVEWLMGWPIGWTDLKPLATDRFQEWQRQHGESSPSQT